MLTSIGIKGFKSIHNIPSLELGQVNVFIGANGSGKSNLLEAVGMLSAAADGRVDADHLLRRGVRHGVPGLYKTSLKGMEQSDDDWRVWRLPSGIRIRIPLRVRYRR